MAFLEVNGYTIPVASVQRKSLLLGGRGRAYTGTPQTQDRGRKLILECKTPPLTELVQGAIIGIVQGDGFVWPWSTPATLRGLGGDLYSHKGVGPATGLDQATVHGYLAGDGAPVSLMSYISPSSEANYTPTRNGMLSVDPDSTNILAADQRDAEGVAAGSYSSYNGAALSMDVTHYWQGAQSVKVVTDAIGADAEGVFTDSADPGAGSATKTYTGSVYVKNGSGAAKSIRVFLQDFTNADTGSFVAITIDDGEWVRVAASITIGGVDCRAIRLYVSENVADSAVTFYCDGFQIEEQDYPTAWVDGARGGIDDLGYDHSSQYPWVDWSAGIWFWGPAVTRAPARHMVLFDIDADSPSTTFSTLYRPSASQDLIRWTTSDAYGTSTDLDTGAGDVDWEAWNFIGVSFRVDPETGETLKTMRLINASGSTTYTDNTANLLAIGEADHIFVGSGGAGLHWAGHLGEFMLFPFAVPVGVWDGIATTLGTAGIGDADSLPLPQWPRKLVTGDAIVSHPVASNARLYGRLFEGDAGSVAVIVANPDTAMRNNLGAVAFTLEEV